MGHSDVKTFIAKREQQICQDKEWAMVANMALATKILLVSSTQATLPLWAFNFMQQRLQVVLETQPAKAFQRWSEETPDIVIFDLDPAESLAIDLVRELREQAVIPILPLSSNRTDKFMLETYQAGVDECIPKPIHPSLFQAKIRAWLRHSWSIPVDMLDSLAVGDVRFIPADRTIAFDDRDPIHLTNLELRLMFYLMSRPGRTVTAEELCQRMWGNYGEGNKTTLKNVVYRLRHKIEADPANPHYIRTVAGTGYQFTPE